MKFKTVYLPLKQSAFDAKLREFISNFQKHSIEKVKFEIDWPETNKDSWQYTLKREGEVIVEIRTTQTVYTKNSVELEIQIAGLLSSMLDVNETPHVLIFQDRGDAGFIHSLNEWIDRTWKTAFHEGRARRENERSTPTEGLPSYEELGLYEDEKKNRKRGPSADTLAKCKDAMKYWLDEDKSLTTASELAGVDSKTVKRWITNVLETVDPPIKEKWTRKLKALEELP